MGVYDIRSYLHRIFGNFVNPRGPTFLPLRKEFILCDKPSPFLLTIWEWKCNLREYVTCSWWKNGCFREKIFLSVLGTLSMNWTRKNASFSVFKFPSTKFSWIVYNTENTYIPIYAVYGLAVNSRTQWMHSMFKIKVLIVVLWPLYKIEEYYSIKQSTVKLSLLHSSLASYMLLLFSRVVLCLY